MEQNYPKALPTFKDRALLHAQGVWPERYIVHEHRRASERRVYKLIPVKHAHLPRPTPVWVTFIRTEHKYWHDVIVRRGQRTAHINVSPIRLAYHATDKPELQEYYHARHIYEGWHHEDPEAEIQYICNPPQRLKKSA